MATDLLRPALAAERSVVEITLKYDGLDVDDGTMAIEDVISALRGFSNAYAKAASVHDPSGQHQIRVAAINRSSFAVSILAWAQANPVVTGALLTATSTAAAAVITLIIKLIEIKKATKGLPPASVTVNGNSNSVVVVTGNTSIEVSKEVYDLFASKVLDGELNKIVTPLEPGKVEAVSIAAKGREVTVDPVVITSSEKGFFRSDESTTSTSKPLDLDGAFVSLNKESNRGRFKMHNGKNVPYHFVGENPFAMHTDFAHKGPVRIQCVATFDSNLELRGLEISRVERLQVVR